MGKSVMIIDTELLREMLHLPAGTKLLGGRTFLTLAVEHAGIADGTASVRPTFQRDPDGVVTFQEWNPQALRYEPDK
jgi:hypothetical protein